jgi:transposase
MLIIGCDYHPSFQQISFVDQETGECGELRLDHKNGEAERFYRKLAGQPVRVGMEATGGMRWFERLLKYRFHIWCSRRRSCTRAKARMKSSSVRGPKGPLFHQVGTHQLRNRF